MKIRTFALLIFAVLTCASVGAETSKSATSKRVFSFRLPDEPATLDWNKAHTTLENYLLMNLMEGLVLLDNDLKASPALAASWKITQKGTVYTFKLRDVYWSDGVKLKAQDFVTSWKRLLDPATAAEYAYLLFDIMGAEDFNAGRLKDFSKVGVHAVDEKTLVIHLARPVANWIYIPTFWVTFPLRQDLLDRYGSGWSGPGRMVTVGPFVLEKHEIDSRIILKKNPRYYRKAGNLDEVHAIIVRDDSTALSLYESGRLHFVQRLPGLEIKRLSKRPDFKKFPALKTVYLGMVNSLPGTNSQLFRRAISRAIDRSKLPELLHGGQLLAHSFIPPGMMGYSSLLGLSYDVAAAKKDLAASGFQKGAKLEMLTIAAEKELITAQYIQNELKKNLDIEIGIQTYDHKMFYAERKLRKHAFFEGTWGVDYPDPDNVLSIFTSQSGNNHLMWKNAQYDELIKKGKVAEDREKLYGQAQKLIIEEQAALLPLYYDTVSALVSSKLQGFMINPVNYMYLKGVSIDP